MINNLSSYSLPIVIDGENSTPYKGQFIDLGIEYVGLERGINEVYEKLKNKNEQ
jgi:hypothetical protein